MQVNSSSHSMPDQKTLDALKILSGAKVVDYMAENGTRRVGLIADGLSATLPQAVEVGSGGGCTVWMEQLIPVLIAAVQQLQEQVEELKHPVEAVKSSAAAKAVVKKKGKPNV